MTFAKEAWPFVLPFAALAVLLFALKHPGYGAAALVVGFLVLLFFRNPTRRFDGGPELIVAPGDGVITRVDVIEDPEIGPGRVQRIVTFLNVFNIHVQRAPTAGVVTVARYTPGRKVAAYREDAGDVNEKQLTVFRRANGDLVGVRQIAGLLARRVVGYLKEGDTVQRGELMGVIKFGSRVDVLVPESYQVLVRKGDRVHDGLTALAAAPAAGEASR
ncbi:MAG TPA: phosphatidylserine decarboxylase family protein [Acidobacteria bacterium]|nr:phosphatidylserine decarboxylase family protein [Acidobacteriota bacterium]